MVSPDALATNVERHAKYVPDHPAPTITFVQCTCEGVGSEGVAGAGAGGLEPPAEPPAPADVGAVGADPLSDPAVCAMTGQITD